jgi:hypothetical protein
MNQILICYCRSQILQRRALEWETWQLKERVEGVDPRNFFLWPQYSSTAMHTHFNTYRDAVSKLLSVCKPINNTELIYCQNHSMLWRVVTFKCYLSINAIVRKQEPSQITVIISLKFNCTYCFMFRTVTKYYTLRDSYLEMTRMQVNISVVL